MTPYNIKYRATVGDVIRILAARELIHSGDIIWTYLIGRNSVEMLEFEHTRVNLRYIEWAQSQPSDVTLGHIYVTYYMH